MGRNDEITFERVFGEENIADALEALSRKRDCSGADGVMLSEVGRFWEINGLGIMESVRKGRHEPEIVRLVEIVNDKGKKRPIAIMSSVDRLILRAVTQLLEPAVDKMLTDNCFAFRTGYGTARAVSRAREHIGSGDRWLSQIDVRDYYESIPIKRAEALLDTLPCDRIITGLLKSYMRPQVEDSGKIYVKRKGILQGSPLSPMIANLYLAPLDEKMEREEMHYCRYADDINVYCRTKEEAQEIFGRLRNDLKNEFGLEIKASKSGVFQAMSQQYLGYTFQWNKKEKAVRAVKVKREKPVQYSTWHRDCVEKVDRNYHIVNDGILTKRDYSILFENKKGKKYLPVETVQGIAIYSNVTFSSDFFRFMRHRKIGISLFDKYGNFVGEFVSESSRNNGKTMLKQAELYLDGEKRLAMAKSMEMAYAHNVRANLRYYQKKLQDPELQKCIAGFGKVISSINEAKSIDDLMLIEARFRQMYYGQFNTIINDDRFTFTQRSKRPPKDPLNALISFGNTYLYNRLATKLHKTSLDLRIGIVHATNNRSQTLNLDLADLFKPVIVDRVIFTMINKNMFDVEKDFHFIEGGGVYLTKRGKRLFVNELDGKMHSKLTVGNVKKSYDALLTDEIGKLYQAICYGKKYKPYKYY